VIGGVIRVSYRWSDTG